MAFLTELADNATKHGISIIMYSGNDDSLVPPRGSEGLWLLILFLFVVLIPSGLIVVIQVCFIHAINA